MLRRAFLASFLLPLTSLLANQRVDNYSPRSADDYSTAGGNGRKPDLYEAKKAVKPLPLKTVPSQRCPGGVCPPPIRIKNRWIERSSGTTSREHLKVVHGWSDDIIDQWAKKGMLDYLHGSPDSPRNPHEHG